MTVLFLTGSLLIATGLFFNKNKLLSKLLIIVYNILLWVYCIHVYNNELLTEALYFTFDHLGILMLAGISIVSVPAFYHGFRYIDTREEETPRSTGIFFGSMVLLITACSMSYLANHIAVTWIFVEITTLSASALIYHHRSIRALEGVWKYVFLCAISITFIYVGILFLSLSIKDAGIDNLSFEILDTVSNNLNPFWLKLAFLFIFTGFTVKMGLVPMYTAGIDAKDKAPGPAGALFASVLMNVGFVGIYRVYAIVSGTPLVSWASAVIMVSAALTIFVATVYMTRIKNIKRLFAYSGIEHMGLIMLGLAAGGIGVYAAILHIVLHTLIKPSLFFQYNQIYRIYMSKSIYDLGNYFRYNKVGAMVVLFGFFSVTAMPPSGLFVSELLIFKSLIESHFILLLVFILLLLTLIIWGLGTNIFKLLFTPPMSIDEKRMPAIPGRESVSQFLLLSLAIYLAYAPPAEFVRLLQGSADMINHKLINGPLIMSAIR